jgi:hypothetical protein
MERRPFFRVLGVASGAVLAETLGVELWDLARAMQASNVSDDMLDAMEASVLRLHQVHAKVSPTTMLPHLHEHLRAVTSLLQQSQPIRQRRRLCSIAGHLVGLRAWATFDLADRQGSALVVRAGAPAPRRKPRTMRCAAGSSAWRCASPPCRAC